MPLDDKQATQLQKNWYSVLYILLLILLFRTAPKVAYGVLIITLLAILFKMQQKK